MLRTKALDAWIDLLLALSVASSFFIVSGGVWKVQPFYLFFVAAVILVALKLCILPEYRSSVVTTWRNYCYPLALFVAAGLVNIFFYGRAHSWDLHPPFTADFFRTILLIVFFIIILVQVSQGFERTKYLRVAFFVPLALAPLLLLADIGKVMASQTFPLFGGYKLQGFQSDNPTALGAWLVVAFALCIVPVFIRQHRPWVRVGFAALSIITLALLWWSNSRGAVIGSLLILTVLILVSWRWRQMKVWSAIGLTLLVVAGSLIMLPRQARTSVFVRFYPAYYNQALEQDFNVPFSFIARGIFGSLPSLTSSQTRGELWADCPMYVLTRPLGEYGPPLTNRPLACGQHNSLFQAAFWSGWVGFGAILWFLVTVLRSAARLLRFAPTDIHALWLSGAFAGVLIQSLLNSFLQFKPLWILGALLIAYAQTRRTDKSAA